MMQIVKAVVMHEAALKAQAKKMNVESLRTGDQSGESAEVKIAKVYIMLIQSAKLQYDTVEVSCSMIL